MIGVPYGRSGLDRYGGYVECPACGWRCRGYDDTQATEEDRMTKGEALAYAKHYVANHSPKEVRK
ncbi:MAG: hypothetical protein EP299_01830 [Acidobacteria bacterium]|nr:MAG: hypothetical protein EP299_01830 [Acidobacteriota bacterium]